MSCRLPGTVVPVKYSIRYDDVDLDRCTFSGQVKIDCQVRHAACYALNRSHDHPELSAPRAGCSCKFCQLDHSCINGYPHVSLSHAITYVRVLLSCDVRRITCTTAIALLRPLAVFRAQPQNVYSGNDYFEVY